MVSWVRQRWERVEGNCSGESGKIQVEKNKGSLTVRLDSDGEDWG